MAYSWGESLPPLDAPRVRLRPLRDDDVPALFEIFGDPDAMRYWSAPPLADMDGARALLEDIRRHFAARTLFQWGIALRADDRVIGTVTIFQIDNDHRRAEIGFALGRAQWGNGYASSAVTALIRFAFETLDLHRIEADPDPQNAASISVLVKQGFKREGFLRERYWLNGEPQDAEYYGLLRREWRKGG
ncbi:MAG: GNAT family N-acetyltransferase [Acidobacteriota bacterium]|nr:GNAT family N-acetyltransferase [Acidobacteriota bacterium]